MSPEVEYLEEHDIVRICSHGQIKGSSEAPLIVNLVEPILEEYSCNRLLHDVRDTEILDSTAETYQVPQIANELEFDRGIKVAILYSQEEEKHKFLETVMLNRGYRFRVFKNESEAISWLKG